MNFTWNVDKCPFCSSIQLQSHVIKLSFSFPLFLLLVFGSIDANHTPKFRIVLVQSLKANCILVNMDRDSIFFRCLFIQV